ncbi:MAG: hypothetical protein ACI9O0_001452 [Paracoccaceae bacterium]|jgi:hypothetical protein
MQQALAGRIVLDPEDRHIIARQTVGINLHLAQISPPVGW